MKQIALSEKDVASPSVNLGKRLREEKFEGRVTYEPKEVGEVNFKFAV